MPEPIYPPRPTPGAKVAVVSQSRSLPAVFPEVYEAGLVQLREQLDLVPVEYPTTRTLDADPRDRARDLHAAFADPEIAAVMMTTIGGDDQIRVLPHLDPEVLRAHPKPFFGYSDNTNLCTCCTSAASWATTAGRSWSTSAGAAGRTRSTWRRCARRCSPTAGTS